MTMIWMLLIPLAVKAGLALQSVVVVGTVVPLIRSLPAVALVVCETIFLYEQHLSCCQIYHDL